MIDLPRFIGKAISGFIVSALEDSTLPVTTPDGYTRYPEPKDEPSVNPIIVHDWSFFWDVMLGYDLGFADSYVKGKWDHPDLTALFEHLSLKSNEGEFSFLANFAPKKAYAKLLQAFKSANTVKSAKQNIQAHYDKSNKFFGAFLDPTMTYSCAIFEKNSDNLETAQRTKLNSLLKLAPVQPGDNILDIGCGWGSLTIMAAQAYQANVLAVTLSKQQYQFCCERIRRLSLESLIRVELEDYRNIEGTFSHIYSIEMLEALGHKGIMEFFEKCSSLLQRGGTLQVQAITIPNQRYQSYRKNCDFIQKYIFPGGLLPSSERIMHAASNAGLKLTDSTSTQSNYSKTLAHWRKNLVDNKEYLFEMGFEPLEIRLFLYYFSYCEGGFRAGHIDNIQFSFLKR